MLSSCGNFVVIGFDNGEVHMFNMQSGFLKGTYGLPQFGETQLLALEAMKNKPLNKCQLVILAHKGAVRGLYIDVVNTKVVTAGADGSIKVRPNTMLSATFPS